MGRPFAFPRPRVPQRKRQAILFAVLLSILAALQQWRPELFHVGSHSRRPPESGRIERVVDGDTLILARSHERVRLIGANTPETVKPDWPVEPWGPEASEFTKRFVAAGEVRLEFDGPQRDKYSRLLAYVWVGERMLNEELIRAGLARAELNYPYSDAMKARFRRAQAEARAARRGIWSDSRSSEKPSTDSRRSNRHYSSHSK
ncbi:MAG: thermonuclease family protein [Planctomycetaceae bacterium]|nr:thermonuclease family protein [Planctomycetaceae bacterium]